MIYTPFIWFPLASAAICGLVAFNMRTFQNVPSVKPFTILMWLASTWAFLYALDASTQSIPLKTFIVNFTYIPALLSTVAWVAVALEYSGREKWLTRRRLIALLIPPALFVIAAFTSHWHTLWRYDYKLIWPGPVPTQIATRGPIYWLYLVYMFGMVAVALGLLLSSRRNSSLNFRSTIILIIGLLIPTITGSLFILDLLPVRGFDWTSTSFIFQLILYIFAILRGHLFDIVPIARNIVMENMDDLVIVTNQRGYIVDLNRAAQNVLGLSPSTIGTAPNKLPQPWADFFQNHNDESDKSEVFLNIQNTSQNFDLTISPIRDKNNLTLGRMFLLHDITERKQVEEILKRQYERQSALHTITLDLLNRHNIEDVLNAILLNVANLLDAPFGLLDILDGDMLVVRATTEMTALHKGLRYPVVDTYLTKMAIYSGQPQFVQNYSQSAQRLKIHDPYHLSAVANTPLVINDRVIGVFALGRTESHIPFTDDDIRIMVLISQLAALAIDNAQLFDMAEHELMERKRTENELRLVNQKLQFQLEQIQSLQLELREQAIRDPLTGLYNRRYLKEILDHELASAERESYPISFVMMDIDHFKKINDTFGHNTGDLILQNLANQLLSQARVGDIICRYGGEEILAVLPNVSIETAYQITERWRISFEDSKQTLTVSRENVETRATISCGISTFPFNGSTRDELIYAADMAMYKAKEMGRNQTIIWQNNST